MTDDERLAIVQMALGKASVLFMASIWSKDVRERVGAQGREQDVSDELLARAIHEFGEMTCGSSYEVYVELLRIQRARAAGKGE